jgi:hypothetical protein
MACFKMEKENFLSNYDFHCWHVKFQTFYNEIKKLNETNCSFKKTFLQKKNGIKI